MSITDELRKYTEEQIKWLDMTKVHYRKLFAIADRIDSAHEEALVSSYFDGVFSDGELAENGFIRLPVDADGEHIRIGDVMAYADNTKPMEVVALVPPAVFITEEGPRYADMCRHYHAPTVEDVLREFALACEDAGNAGPEVTRLAAEYAAKLRLAGEDE